MYENQIETQDEPLTDIEVNAILKETENTKLSFSLTDAVGVILPIILVFLFLYRRRSLKASNLKTGLTTFFSWLSALLSLFVLYLWIPCISRNYCTYEQGLPTTYVVLPIALILLIVWLILNFKKMS